MASSPTQRTRAALLESGYTSSIVERWNQHAHIRQDLFGFIDVLALGRGETLAIQTTTADHVSKRRAKIEQDCPHFAAVLDAGWTVEVWGWGKKCLDGKRGARKVWTLKRERYLGPNNWIEVI